MILSSEHWGLGSLLSPGPALALKALKPLVASDLGRLQISGTLVNQGYDLSGAIARFWH